MATRWDNLPGLKDDVVARDREDTAKAKKGREVDSSKLSGGAKDAVREAGKRAENRKVGRRGAGVAAFEIGYGAGRALDEKTGLGKKMVDKSGLGSAAEKAANMRDKVELSKDAKARLDEEEVDNYRREIEAEDKARKAYSGKDEESYKGDGMKRGGRVKKMASGGMTSGASSASKRADGIATKGKTRGKMC
jgi:hypothetical protein